MLLRNSITNTKKFFQKTLDNVKSFISKGSSTYQKLPKSPPLRPFSCGRDRNDQIMDGDAGYNNNNENDLDHFYNEFTHQWDINSSSRRMSKVKNKVQRLKSSVRAASAKKSHHQQFFSLEHVPRKENCNFAATADDSVKTSSELLNGEFQKGTNNAAKGEFLKSKRILEVNQGIMKLSDLCSRSVRERRLNFVAEKMKELEVMDRENIDHKRDVDEFLQYYSRLTCPAYLDIIDKFLKEMCAEFFGAQASPKAKYSTPVWKAVKV